MLAWTTLLLALLGPTLLLSPSSRRRDDTLLKLARAVRRARYHAIETLLGSACSLTESQVGWPYQGTLLFVIIKWIWRVEITCWNLAWIWDMQLSCSSFASGRITFLISVAFLLSYVTHLFASCLCRSMILLSQIHLANFSSRVVHLVALLLLLHCLSSPSSSRGAISFKNVRL